jgi:hypothetical protein
MWSEQLERITLGSDVPLAPKARLRFWHRRCHAAAEKHRLQRADARGCDQATRRPLARLIARLIAIKKLERVASEGKFLLSHQNH